MGRLLSLSPLVALAPLSSLLSACGKKPPPFDNLDITGSRGFDTAFSLPDTKGRLRTLADFNGKVLILFFGYTQCPDVCPTSLAELAQARKDLGAAGKQMQVVFVSVDPDRDTPAILDQYMAAFDPDFIALRPVDNAAVAKISHDFHIYVARVPVPAAQTNAASAPGSQTNSLASGYTVEHTAASYVFDPRGTLRLYARDGGGAARWVHDVNLLLNEPV